MRFRESTAVRGVLSAAVLNLAARIFLFLRHVAVTALIGLTAGLDAFNIAFFIVGVFTTAAGDIADSVGVPALVRSFKEEGAAGFRKVCASVFRFSLTSAAVVSGLLLLLAPFCGRLLAGSPPETRAAAGRHLFILLPMAFCYLPYRALGSMFRARRLFQAFYLAEALIAAAGLAVYMLQPRSHFMLPAAWSASYVAGFLFLLVQARASFGPPAGGEDRALAAGLFRESGRLLPAFAAIYVMVLSSLALASLLPTGSVSALSYAILLSFAVPGVLSLENVFITPISESGNDGGIMGWIVKGCILLSVPVVIFTVAFAMPIVQAVFQRGAFTAESSAMTASALSAYALSVPYLFLGPICVRTFMVSGRMGAANAVSAAAAAANALLAYALAFRFGMGIRGIALAAAVSGTLLLAAFLWILRARRIDLGARHVTGVLLPALGASVAGLLVARALPHLETRLLDVFARGTAFVLAYIVTLRCIPTDDLRGFAARIRAAAVRTSG